MTSCKQRSIYLSIYLSVSAYIFFSNINPCQAGEFHINNEFAYTYNDITGPGASSSALTQGWRYLDALNLTGNGKVGEYDYNLNIGAKATDDPRNDIKNISLTNLQGRITNKIHTLNLGDTFESFSQYSLNSAVKGGSYKFAYDKGSIKLPEVTIISGIAAPRWDSVWRDDQTKVVERQVYGGRIKYALLPDLSTGFNMVTTSDDKRVFSTDPLYKSNIYSFDMEYKPLKGLTINGEVAITNTSLQAQEGAAETKSSGNAYRIQAVGDQDPSRVSLEYELVEPDFLTLLGSATPDREKAKAKWRYKYSKTITMNTGFLWFHDNLNGQKSSTTQNYVPEIGVSVKNLFKRQYSVVDLSYKYNRRYSSAQDTIDHITNISYRDRFGPLDSDTNIGYTIYDSRTSITKSKEWTYNTSLSSRHTLGDVVWKPSVAAGGWNASDELAMTRDKIYQYSAGMGMELPKLKVTSELRVGQNKMEKETADNDSMKSYGNFSIYWRPKFLEKLSEGMVFVKAMVNDYNYSAFSKDYRESSVTIGLNFRY